MSTSTTNTPQAGIDADALTSWFLDNISDILGVEPEDLDPNQKLTEYGMDSRQFIDLTFDLEELLGRTLPATLFWDNQSIAALVKTLAS